VNNAIKVVVVIIVAVLLIFSYFVIYHNNPAPPIKKNVPLLLEVEFIESGLPSGKKWTVSMAGSSESSSNNTIIFRENNGTYSYTVLSGDPDFSPSVASGSVSLNGKAVLQSVSFIMLYNASFYEEGMPSGTRWFVNISDPQSFNSTSNSIVIQLPNGTYSYTVSAGSLLYEPLHSYSSGSFSIDGDSVTPAPQSSPIIMERVFPVAFNETGLKDSVAWHINVSGIQSFSSNSSTILFYEPNATYNYSASASGYSAYPSPGKFTVSGYAVNRTINFTKLYSVLFIESGIPTNTSWSVELGQEVSGSTSSSITFVRPNGSYSYTIGIVKGFSASLPYGTIKVAGKDIKLEVKFIANNTTKYSITFTATGLPNGTSWTVDLNGMNESSSSKSIIFYEPNSTYLFSIPNGSGYTASPESGSVNVNGSNLTITIVFSSITIPVTFSETGLPGGTSWKVQILFVTGNNGSSLVLVNLTKTSNSSNIIFNLPDDKGSLVYLVYNSFSPDYSEFYLGVLSGEDVISVYDYSSPLGFDGNAGFYGTSINFSVQFTITYNVTVRESGLTQFLSWVLSLDGSNPWFFFYTNNNLTFYGNSTNPEFFTYGPDYFYLPNGSWHIYNITGYWGTEGNESSPSPSNYSFEVNGGPQSITVTFDVIPNQTGISYGKYLFSLSNAFNLVSLNSYYASTLWKSSKSMIGLEDSNEKNQVITFK
jgi:hypothetical protein